MSLSTTWLPYLKQKTCTTECYIATLLGRLCDSPCFLIVIVATLHNIIVEKLTVQCMTILISKKHANLLLYGVIIPASLL